MSSGPASRITNTPSQASQDIAADGPREGVTDMPSTAYLIIQFTVGGGASPESNEALATVVSPAVIPDSPSSLPLMLALAALEPGTSIHLPNPL